MSIGCEELVVEKVYDIVLHRLDVHCQIVRIRILDISVWKPCGHNLDVIEVIRLFDSRHEVYLIGIVDMRVPSGLFLGESWGYV